MEMGAGRRVGAGRTGSSEAGGGDARTACPREGLSRQFGGINWSKN